MLTGVTELLKESTQELLDALKGEEPKTMNDMKFAISLQRTNALQDIRCALIAEDSMCVGKWGTGDAQFQSACLFGAAVLQTERHKPTWKAKLKRFFSEGEGGENLSTEAEERYNHVGYICHNCQTNLGLEEPVWDDHAEMWICSNCDTPNVEQIDVMGYLISTYDDVMMKYAHKVFHESKSKYVDGGWWVAELSQEGRNILITMVEEELHKRGQKPRTECQPSSVPDYACPVILPV